MPNRVPVDNVEHHALRVAERGLAEFDQVNQTLVVPTEFEQVQREFPIVIRRDVDGEFAAIALLGLDKGENLFLDDGVWSSRYVPAVHRRGPFFIGVRQQEGAVGGDPELVLHIDLEDPRSGDPDGQPLFKPHGGTAPYLEHVTEALFAIHEGLAAAPSMFALLAELDLIQPIELNIDLGDGLTYSIPNFFTVGEEQLAGLGGQALDRLNRSGFLPAAVFLRSSLGNLGRLIELKNQRRAAV